MHVNHMLRRQVQSTLAAAATAVCAMAATPALAQSAGSITYNVDQTIAAGSVVGDIVTDGRTGTLVQSDITSWNLFLNGVGATTNLTNANSTVHVVGGDLVVTGNNLTFNYNGSDGGYLLFQPSFGSGSQYYCNNTSWYGCKPGASVVPKSYSDPSAQYATVVGIQTIGTATMVVPVDQLGNSINNLANSRTGQMLFNQLQNNRLLGGNEQISCGDCGGTDMTVGSFALSGHGRLALSRELTLLGGLTVGTFQHHDANVRFTAGTALALRFDAVRMGKSRPFFEVGGAASLSDTTYARSYATGASGANAVGGATARTSGYSVSTYARVGWVDRISKRDEAAVFASITKMWQGVSHYAEQGSTTNPFPAAVPDGTDEMSTASVSAQYTHLFGRRTEVDLNGGYNRSFNATSGVNAQFGNLMIHPGRPDFTYYDVGGRIGLRLKRWLTLDLYANAILAPKAIGSSTHGGFALRIAW